MDSRGKLTRVGVDELNSLLITGSEMMIYTGRVLNPRDLVITAAYHVERKGHTVGA